MQREVSRVYGGVALHQLFVSYPHLIIYNLYHPPRTTGILYYNLVNMVVTSLELDSLKVSVNVV